MGRPKTEALQTREPTKEQMKKLPDGSFKFFPLKSFTWTNKGTFMGAYLVGPQTSYNCTENPIHDELRRQCAIWQDEDRIQVLPAKLQMINIRSDD